MSSPASVTSPRADSSTPIVRRESKNTVFSTIVRIALATLGIVASYAFLPPVGATIVSSIIIVVTIMSFFDLHSPTILMPPADPPIVISPWRRRFNYFRPNYWFYRPPTTTPLTTRREATRSPSVSTPRAPVGTGRVTPAPVRTGWFSSNPFAAHSPAPARAATRIATDNAATRIPVGTAERAYAAGTNFSAPSAERTSNPSPNLGSFFERAAPLAANATRIAAGSRR